MAICFQDSDLDQPRVRWMPDIPPTDGLDEPIMPPTPPKPDPATTLADYSLPRTGLANVQFSGYKLAFARSPAYRRFEQNPDMKAHWFECAVYKTKGGTFVLAIAYRWSGKKIFRESNQDIVSTHKTEDELVEALRAVTATEYVNGYPEGEHWVKKQEALMNSIEEDFAMLVEIVESQLGKYRQPEVIE